MARAQSDDELARRHFRIGQAHYENGEFAEAATEFEEAFRLSQRATLLYNVYLAHRDAAHIRQAAASLRQYLELVPDAPDRDTLEARLVSMDRLIASMPPEAGHPPGEEPPPTEQPEETPVETPSSEPSVTADAPADEAPASSPVPWITMGAGGAFVVLGTVAGVISRNAMKDLEAGCDPNDDCPMSLRGTRDRGVRMAHLADASFAIGGAALVTGLVLYFVMRPDGEDEAEADTSDTTPRASVACDGHGCMAVVGGRF